MCKCIVRITENDPRADLWRKINPDLIMPLKHPLTENGYLEGDPKRLTEQQKDILATEITKLFSLTKDEVLKDLEKGIFPIKNSGCIITICKIHTLCFM